MPYRVSVDHGARTIIVTGSGAGTTADTLRLVDELTPTLQECRGYDLLYDSLELQIMSSPADMIRVAEALFDRRNAELKRFAIVVPESRVHLARMFTALAHPHGVMANVFIDLSDARRWLGLDPA